MTFEISQELVDAYWSQVDARGWDECWIWHGPVFRNSGYGQATSPKKPMCAHRLGWIITNGPLPTYVAPDGREASLRVAHNCPGGMNKLCCNPAHISLLTEAADGVHRAHNPR